MDVGNVMDDAAKFSSCIHMAFCDMRKKRWKRKDEKTEQKFPTKQIIMLYLLVIFILQRILYENHLL